MPLLKRKKEIFDGAKPDLVMKIEGMGCKMCADKVKSAIEGTPGVARAEVSLEKREAAVFFKNGETAVKSDLSDAVTSKGYVVTGIE